MAIDVRLAHRLMTTTAWKVDQNVPPALVERIWVGTSEIRRRIVSPALLGPLGA